MLDAAKKALEKCARDVKQAQEQVGAALAEEQRARLALNHPEKPLTQEQTAKREDALHAARTAVAHAHFEERRALAAHDEAEARVGRMTPHAAALARLDKLGAAIAAKDKALTDLGLELHARVAAQVRDLRKTIQEADAIFTALPVEVRSADLSLPRMLAPFWGGAGAEGDDLLRLMSTALWARFGRVPSSADCGGAA